MKTPCRVRRDRRGVSPVIGTILLVAITVVLAAVLYVMVSGLLGTGTGPQTIGVARQDTANDYVLEIVTVPSLHALATTTFLMRWDANSSVVMPPGLASLKSLENESGRVRFLPVTGAGQVDLRPSDEILISKSSPYAAGVQMTIGDGTTVLWMGSL